MVANKSNTRKEKKRKKRKVGNGTYFTVGIFENERKLTSGDAAQKKEAKRGGAKATEKLTSAYISYVRVILLSFWVTVCVHKECALFAVMRPERQTFESQKKRNLNKVLLLGG